MYYRTDCNNTDKTILLPMSQTRPVMIPRYVPMLNVFGVGERWSTSRIVTMTAKWFTVKDNGTIRYI